MNKEEKYTQLLSSVQSLIDGESNLIANLANIAAAIKESFGFLWVGFYLVESASDQLVLGPFQGPIACTRINYGRGVCGISWKQNGTIVVEDVEQFPGHIACSSLSRSEIVIPIHHNGIVVGVLDIDDSNIGTFDQIDASFLEEIVNLIKWS